MSDELEDNETRISASKHPNNYVKAVIGNMNNGHDEVVMTATGQAQQNLERVLGKLLMEDSLEGSVYSMPEFEVESVEGYTAEFDNDDGGITEVEGKKVTISVA